LCSVRKELGSLSPLFGALATPPLLLPWSKVTAVEEKNYFFFRLLRITLSDAVQTFTFELPLSAKPEIAHHLAKGKGALELR
jgi:hypothetical protein